MANPKKILNSWTSNYGIHLLAVGVAVGGLMCVLWYYQWLPEIQFSSARVVSRPASPQDPKTYLVTRIRNISKPNKNPATDPVDGTLLVFGSVAGGPNDQRLPLATVPFEFDADGVATLVQPLAPGNYAAIAYLDANQNGQLDVDESGQPIEPFRTTNTSDVAQDWRDLRSAEFSLEPMSVHFALLDFND